MSICQFVLHVLYTCELGNTPFLAHTKQVVIVLNYKQFMRWVLLVEQELLTISSGTPEQCFIDHCLSLWPLCCLRNMAYECPFGFSNASYSESFLCSPPHPLKGKMYRLHSSSQLLLVAFTTFLHWQIPDPICQGLLHTYSRV